MNKSIINKRGGRILHKKYFIMLFIYIILISSVTAYAKVIDSKSIYTSGISQKTNEALENLHTHYSDITELVTIGQSAKNETDIKAIRLGKGERHILINGAHHGRESLTTILTLDQLEYLAEAYRQNKTINGQNVRQVLNTVSLWFVPLVNPDGAEIAMSTYPSWKANGRGVDLNRNYPTLYAQNKTSSQPGPQGYAGPYPFSEPETQALYELYEQYNFEASIAYHSAGEVIYWWYYQTGKEYEDSLYLAKVLSKMTGYALVPSSASNGGLGFTDWVIQTKHKPGFTIEIGKIVNGKPLKWEEYSRAWKKNKDVPLTLTTEIIKMHTSETEFILAGELVKGQKVFDTPVVPVKEAVRILNLSYSYDPQFKIITLRSENKKLAIQLGEKEITYNGEIITLPVPAYISNGTSYIPLDIVSNIFLSEYDIPKEQEEMPQQDNTEDKQIEEEGTEETMYIPQSENRF